MLLNITGVGNNKSKIGSDIIIPKRMMIVVV
jgi:hypothetical protein